VGRAEDDGRRALALLAPGCPLAGGLWIPQPIQVRAARMIARPGWGFGGTWQQRGGACTHLQAGRQAGRHACARPCARLHARVCAGRRGCVRAWRTPHTQCACSPTQGEKVWTPPPWQRPLLAPTRRHQVCAPLPDATDSHSHSG